MSANIGSDNDDQNSELLPPRIRLLGSVATGFVSLAIIAYFLAHIFCKFGPAPKDLDLSTILVLTTVGFLFFSIPWRQLGFSLTKFGPLEFERKLEGQSEEHIQVISLLEERIDDLETLVQAVGGQTQQSENSDAANDALSVEKPAGAPISRNTEKIGEAELRELVVSFLTQYSKWAFSPSRIENWGSTKPGFENLSNDGKLLRKTLRKLVADGVADTKISQKGLTLYKISS
ncbi:hypothetical protein EOI86_20540 [Hwanghaeella grinnelliae]|uniref:Uncharacterized protein n=1 Tax=Hwanghaeella grinnelliae TaxID=2500179 RepID=A0A3S2Y1Q7_9PROT|nr:hypothetical protein [Hwanghaeella grinnelliae]RVU35205.1 hypothetical protein EOI86_20540 [Hwanghaeella grinnelliae]